MEPQDTPQPQTPPTPPTPQTKNSLVLIMSILLIVTVAIAGLFYFQIQKLSKELSKYQTQPSPTPTATTDPTANWEIYNSSPNYGKYFWFSFKYPNSIQVGGYGSIPGPFTGNYSSLGGLSDPTVLKEGTDVSFDGFTIYGVVSEAGGIEKYVDNEVTAMSKSEVIGNKELIKTSITLNGIKGYSVDFSPTLKYYYLSSPDRKAIIVISRTYANQSFLAIFDQILSTFKFTGSTSIGITKDEAVQLVKSLDEVKTYLVTVPNAIVEFDHESDDKTLWVVHVYEIKDNHTATFNWYEVNKSSSKINKMF